MPKKGRQPATRISSGQVKRMMQSDEEVGRMVAAVPVMVARLTEMFVTRLLATTGAVVADRGAKTLAPEHVAAVIREDDRLDFLLPLVKNVRDTNKNKTSPPVKENKQTKDKDGKSNKSTLIVPKSMSKVTKRDSKAVSEKVRSSKKPKASAAKDATAPTSDPSCGRVLQSSFTITNLLGKADQAQSMGLDEDYD